LPASLTANDDRSKLMILCRIAHIDSHNFRAAGQNRALCFDNRLEVSNSDQLLLKVSAIIMLETVYRDENSWSL